MEENNYSINLRDLSIYESLIFPDSFKEYSEMAEFLLRRKSMFMLEDNLIELHKDEPEVKDLMELGNIPIGAITAAFPNRFLREGMHPKIGGAEDEGVWGWLDLWSDYVISPQDELYDLFFTYKLKHTDILELDNILNYFFENYNSDNNTDFIRFLKLTLRKHGNRLVLPEQLETINEWIIEKEKEVALSGTVEPKTKVRIKRERDDKVTLLNQEQTALLIHCLRKTRVILIDEFLNNKEAGQAFSILTGYSADTLRQNLNKSETANIATIKNVEVVEKALKEVLKYIEKQVKPE
jgi:hypothetical protein